MFGDVDVDQAPPERVEIHHPDWAEGRVLYLRPAKDFFISQRARIKSLVDKSERQMVTVKGPDGAPLKDENGDTVYVPLIKPAVHDEGVYWESVFADMLVKPYWNFTQRSKDPAKDGKPLPFAEPWKSRLFAEYGAWIAGEIEQLAGGVAAAATTFRPAERVQLSDPTQSDGSGAIAEGPPDTPADPGTVAASEIVETVSADAG